MNIECALCGSPLTSMDTILGENKLSDGGILCNKCLNKATNVNTDLVSNLANYSIIQIKSMVLNGGAEQELAIETEPFETIQIAQPRIVETPSQSIQFTYTPDEPSRLDEIKDQIVATGAKLSLFVDSEVEELVNVLDENEKLIAIAEGKYLHNNLEGIVVSTERRIIFVDKKFFGGVFENEFPLQKVSSVQHDTSLISSTLKVYTSGFTAEFKLYIKSAAKNFSDAVQDYIGRSEDQIRLQQMQAKQQQQQQQQVVQQSPKPQQNSEQKAAPSLIFEQLERLGKLREMGVLTEEEFAEQKKKLLAKL
ncbi:PH domain-containing protein [Chryseobacterium herbae]|uniref:PH domain-containing protein n=1 Tax=Chryseobacterium herbae TaxID=2976476 RepID=A0ABT2IZA8_9FLAO|nr:PH domain-containing protein [Chryseobacterium sp. pc1-10]MCT2564189.1 PH domain-containing protein [Chryseobacterium sp. pc1-10]